MAGVVASLLLTEYLLASDRPATGLNAVDTRLSSPLNGEEIAMTFLGRKRLRTYDVAKQRIETWIVPADTKLCAARIHETGFRGNTDWYPVSESFTSTAFSANLEVRKVGTEEFAELELEAYGILVPKTIGGEEYTAKCEPIAVVVTGYTEPWGTCSCMTSDGEVAGGGKAPSFRLCETWCRVNYPNTSDRFFFTPPQADDRYL